MINLSLVRIRAYGTPAPQGSKKHIGKGILIESSKRVKPWREEVLRATLDSSTYSGQIVSKACSLYLEFLIPRPKSHFGTGRNRGRLKPSAPQYCTSNRNGDLDKLCRSTIDGLSVTSGGVLIEDDSLVVQITSSKRYCLDKELAGALIVLNYPTIFPISTNLENYVKRRWRETPKHLSVVR